MSRLRTDLRASLPPRRSSSTKLPPVRGGSQSPCASPQNWATDMVIGLQLRTTSPPKETRSRSTAVSPKERIKDIINRNTTPKKTAPNNGITQLDKLEQEVLSLKAQEQQYLDKIAKLEKEIEVSILNTSFNNTFNYPTAVSSYDRDQSGIVISNFGNFVYLFFKPFSLVYQFMYFFLSFTSFV